MSLSAADTAIMEFRDTRIDGPEHALSEAFRALDAGEHQKARGLAQSALIAAKESEDQHTEARALSCLAHCDRVAARPRRASETSRRAAQMFQRLGDADGESFALDTVSHCCMVLGRNDEAVEAALLSVRLCDIEKPTVQSVLAHNCLGMAYCWSGNFDRANDALEMAIHLAARTLPAMSPYQTKLNQLRVEVARLVNERYQTGAMVSLRRIGTLVREVRRLEHAGDALEHLPGILPMARIVSVAMKGLYSAWLGEVRYAQVYADRAIRMLGGTATWLDALVRWVLAERAWADKDWSGAEVALVEMRSLASAVEHENMACLAHLLLVQVYEAQGKMQMAQLEARALRSREQRMAAESMSGREAVVNSQLGARQSERHLEQALVASRQFERWSFEDALTGIANRRCFERSLAERLPASVATGRPLTVAMVDLDRFKSVNDTYSHQVGDRVLKAVATLMASSVRENDIAARLAGDEFVVLFSDADEDTALEICERIRKAIAAFDWDAIAPGLQVSVSIGVSQAIEGDTVESIVHRSDKSMYSAKPGWFPTSLSDLEA